MTRTKRAITGFFTFLLFSGALLAQESDKLSDKEFDQFVDVFKEIQTIEQESQGEMIQIIEDEGLDVDRFNEILQAEQDPTQQSDATDKEVKKFNASMDGIKKIQEESQNEMVTQISEKGLTVERYQEINTILQTDQQLQQKLMEKLQD